MFSAYYSSRGDMIVSMFFVKLISAIVACACIVPAINGIFSKIEEYVG